MKENIHKIFEDCNETIVWSCLQGIMGEIHTNLSEDAAMAILGDFAFFAGNPSEELIRFKPESSKRDFIIMVSRNAMWANLIKKCYKDKAKKVIRYAIKKEAIYNKWSAALAEKLGYHFSHEYTAYEVTGY